MLYLFSEGNNQLSEFMSDIVCYGSVDSVLFQFSDIVITKKDDSLLFELKMLDPVDLVDYD